MSNPETKIKTENEYVLWQLPGNGSFKSMSYCLKTPDGFRFAIDGGSKKEAELLKDFIIENFEGKVDAWFITHPHRSHTEAFIDLSADEEISIGKIIYSYVDFDDAVKYEPERAAEVLSFNKAVKKNKTPTVRVRNGDRIKLGKTIIKVFCAQNLDTQNNFINNSGAVFKFYLKTASVIFLGDLGIEGGLSLISSHKDELKCDILQISHHGFGGVSNEVYDIISPDICMWDTSKEVWIGNKNVLLSERTEMKEAYKRFCNLGVTEHYVAGRDGISEIHIAY